MLNERLNQLFRTYNSSIQTLIAQVLMLEQAHIMVVPKVKTIEDQM